MTWTRSAFVPAFAKLNLTLEVLGRRPDGFHDLASVMQTISLHDTLALHPAPAGRVTLDCDVAALAGPDNLALRAALAVAAASPGVGGVHIELHKETPTQAGVGGGSADAAAVLLALPRLWGVDLPRSHLLRLAAALGSDVPFFLTSGTASIAGRGEEVRALPDLPPQWLVLAKPPVAVPTGPAFAALTPRDYADGTNSAAVAAAVTASAPLPAERLVNSFLRSILRDYPPVADLERALREAGAPAVYLSGSGPTLFAPFGQLAVAAAVYRLLRDAGHAVWLVRTLGRRAALAAVSAALEEALAPPSEPVPSELTAPWRASPAAASHLAPKQLTTGEDACADCRSPLAPE